jgi:hypothetical protein
MNAADLQGLLDRVLPKPVSAIESKGLTRWMDLGASSRMPKERPWTCGGRLLGAGNQVAWFPRTTKKPTTDACYAVPSPAGQLPRFTKQGWFLANMYVLFPPGAAAAGAEAGVLPAAVIDQLEAKLAQVYRR